MKRVFFIFMIVILFLSLFACSSAEPEPTPTETEPVSTIAPTPEPTETVALATTSPEPANLSSTTGLPYDVEYQPVMAVIENSPAARPQTGLQTADVVYEVPVEGSITRFVCVFSDNVPEEVMPVRSGRVPFLYIQHEWDAVFMHFGGSGFEPEYRNKPFSFYGHALHEDLKFDVDGLLGKWNDYFYRVSGKDRPHNVMGNPLLAQALYDYNPEALHWLFDNSATYSGDNVTEIKLKMCSKSDDYVSYVYDIESDVYMRFMSGKPFKSAETDRQVNVKNLIVQYSTYIVDTKVKLWDMVGKGDADFYIGGKLIKGSWTRESADSETIYYDDKGEQIVFRPGNTWIHIHPEV